MLLTLQNISKQYGSKVLFTDASLRIEPRSRIALIGPNGAGKSTLFKILLELEHPDSGSLRRAKHLTVGHLAQEVPKFSNRTLLEEVMSLDGKREKVLASKAELEESLSKANSDSNAHQEDLEHYALVLEELEHLDEYRLESRAKEILSGMRFKQEDFNKPLQAFSGGWLMRAALSRLLLQDPELLLLDEPTNHLDLESLLWLEEFLNERKGALLMISHDTAFLDRIANEVLEIDQGKLWQYRGNIEAYATQKAERLELLKSQYANQQEKIEALEGFINRFRAKATKARQAQSRMKQLDKIERIKLPDARSTVRFRFPPASHSGKEVVTLKDVSFSWSADKPLYEKLNWIIPRGARVAIVGPNGVGKTTLLKLIAGELRATAGEYKLGHLVQRGYYAQHQAEKLDMNKTIVKELEMTAPDMPVSQVRGIAGAFLFSGDAVEKRCGILSGGEKARVALAKLLLSPSNFMILDEPTNHLDVESREVLLEALQEYEGTLCLVSHDREFIGPLVDSVLEIVPGAAPGKPSTARMLVGSYNDYLELKIREIHEERSRAKKSSSSKAQAPLATKPESSAVSSVESKRPSNNQLQTWRRARDQAEAEIARLERRSSEINDLLAKPEIYENPEKALPLTSESQQIHAKMSENFAIWEGSSAELERWEK